MTCWRFLLFFLLLFYNHLLPGQVSGCLGRRVIAKADLAHPLIHKGPAFGVEVAVLRPVSMSVGYRASDQAIVTRLSDNVSYAASFPAKLLTAEVRIYCTEPFLAPTGFYFQFYRKLGKADIDIEQTNYYYNGISYDPVKSKYTVQGVKLRHTGVGLGYQAKVMNRLIFDTNVSLEAGYIKDEKYRVNERIRQQYGSHMNFYSPEAGNVLGISFDLQVGFLLF